MPYDKRNQKLQVGSYVRHEMDNRKNRWGTIVDFEESDKYGEICTLKLKNRDYLVTVPTNQVVRLRYRGQKNVKRNN